MVVSTLADCFNKATIDILFVNPNVLVDEENLDALVFSSARKALFFDEKAPLYLLLHAADGVEYATLERVAHRIDLTIEASISDVAGRTNAPPLVRQDSTSRTGRQDQGQIIYSKTMDNSSQLHIGRHENHYVILWRHDVPISFAKTNSSTPKVSFSASMTLTERAMEGPDVDSYIDISDTGLRDANYNLLRGLESDVFLRTNPPELSAAKVSVLRPLAEQGGRKAKKSARRAFPVHSAISLRIRSFNIPSSTRVVLSIDLEPAQASKHDIEFLSIDLQISHVKPIALGPSDFPMLLKDGEAYTYAFDLAFNSSSLKQGSEIPATLVIHSRPITNGTEATKGPLLISKWSTTIQQPQEMESPNTHYLEDVTPQRLQRSTSGLLQTNRLSSISDKNSLSGVVVTLRPPQKGRVGQVVDIPIYITNNAPTPKTINIDVSRAPRKKDLPRPPSSEVVDKEYILSKESLQNLHAQGSSDGIDFLCLTNHIKVGQVLPGAQVKADLQYLAIREGVVELQDLRIVEVNTGVFHEIKDLSTIQITS